MTDHWITTKTAARRLNLSICQVGKLCRDGTLLAEQTGPRRGWLIDPVSVRAYRPAKRLGRKEAIQAANIYLSGDCSLGHLSRLFKCSKDGIKNAWRRYRDDVPYQELQAMARRWSKTPGEPKLNPAKVRQIRQWRAEGRSAGYCAYKYGVDRSTAYRIDAGESWGWVR